MRIASVNVGRPREVIWKGMQVRTAIFKEPVAGPVALGHLNLAGDEQADLTVHGGADKAVYAYPVEHYPYWRRELPELNFVPGIFGENLTTEGLLEDQVCIGDRVRIGSALLTVTQPRLPCYKLALRFDRDDIIKRFLSSGRSGFYFSVIETGVVNAGSEMDVVSHDPYKVTVADVLTLYFSENPDPELIQRATRLTALPANWKAQLRLKAATRPGS